LYDARSSPMRTDSIIERGRHKSLSVKAGYQDDSSEFNSAKDLGVKIRRADTSPASGALHLLHECPVIDWCADSRFEPCR